MKIFFSYGHDEFEKLAQRLKEDLNDEGFEIWIDKDQIKGTADWEMAIEKGISSSDWLVLLMTEHSVRRPDGVCLDEVSYARYIGKQIAPIMIQDVQPPLCIARIQWIDMKNFLKPGKAYFDEEAYQKRKGELIAILQGIKKLSSEGEQHSLKTRLCPLDNDVFSSNFRRDFFGREKLIAYYDEWFNSDKRLLWLVGNAGVGKTAFIANLTGIREEISAVHFCRYNDNERANPKRAIMSIAYYLATQIEEYKKQILQLQDLALLSEKSTSRLFEYLIVEPLNKVVPNHKPIVIVIDALDEATVDNRNELADVIVSQFSKTPSWVKLLVTSRNETMLQRKFGKIRPISFSDKDVNDNESDIYGYFGKHLDDILPKGKKGERILSILTKKSEGIFLYAKNILEDIREKKLDLSKVNDFPEGLTGIYLEYFDRIFSRNENYSYKKDIRPILEILCATYMPVSRKLILKILDIDEYDLDDILDLICEMFPTKDNIIEPIHKSIVDWLIDSNRSGSYRISKRKGHERIADYNLSLLKSRKWNHYTLQYLCRHLIAVERDNEAIDILSQEDFQCARIKVVGLDSAIREYLYEIKELNRINSDSADQVMQSSTFEMLFSKHRKYFYNSGLYFSLKEIGFDRIAKTEFEKNGIEYGIGVAYYYYITESFNITIQIINKLLATENVPSESVAELYNLLALCYRKYVDFAKSKDFFEKAYNCNSNSDYDQSISLINLGKIAYHELDWGEADKWNKQAVNKLLHELERADNDDSRSSLTLFLAEYHRLTAECLIWNSQLEDVNRELDIAEKLYNTVTSRDRYYVRYLYTSLFRNILKGDFQNAFDDCDVLFEQATSAYDKSQILFYKSISAMKLHENEELKKSIVDAYNYASSIGAWLELEEIVALANYGGVQIENVTHCKEYQSNDYIRKWIGHVNSFFDTILR